MRIEKNQIWAVLYPKSALTNLDVDDEVIVLTNSNGCVGYRARDTTKDQSRRELRVRDFLDTYRLRKDVDKAEPKRVGKEHGPAKPSTWGPELRLTFRDSTELRHKFKKAVAQVVRKEYLEIDVENELERIKQCNADILDAQEKIKNLSQNIKELNAELMNDQM